MGDWLVALLGPFLVIALIAVVAAAITLWIRARRQWSTRPLSPPLEEKQQEQTEPNQHGGRL